MVGLINGLVVGASLFVDYIFFGAVLPEGFRKSFQQLSVFGFSLLTGCCELCLGGLPCVFGGGSCFDYSTPSRFSSGSMYLPSFSNVIGSVCPSGQNLRLMYFSNKYLCRSSRDADGASFLNQKHKTFYLPTNAPKTGCRRCCRVPTTSPIQVETYQAALT